MSNAAVFLGGADVSVAAAGALGGSGAVGNPLTVEVDGDTISIVGNQLVADVASGGILHQATVTLTNAQIIARGGVTVIPTPGANKIIVFQGGLLIVNVTAGVYGNVNSYAATWTLGYDQTGDQIAFSGWNTDLLTTGTVNISQLAPFVIPDGNDPPLALVTFVYTSADINKAVTIDTSNALGAFNGGNAANTMICSVSYLILNTLTGLFE